MKTIRLFFTHTVLRGLLLGSCAGLVLSVIYAMLGLIIMESLGMGTGLFEAILSTWSANPYDQQTLAELFVLLFDVGVMLFSIFVGAIVPAVLLGALTGIWLGKFTELAQKHFPKYMFVSLCVLSCLGIVILIHILFRIPIVLSLQNLSDDILAGSYKSYPFAIGIPSIIYVLTGGWVVLQLYTKVSTE